MWKWDPETDQPLFWDSENGNWKTYLTVACDKGVKEAISSQLATIQMKKKIHSAERYIAQKRKPQEEKKSSPKQTRYLPMGNIFQQSVCFNMCLQMEEKQDTIYSSETFPISPANEMLKSLKQYQARTGLTSYHIMQKF